MTVKRFELKSFHFHNLTVVIYDHLNEEELHLTIYQLINLLNEVSQQEYDLRKLGNEINKKIDEILR